MPSTFAYAGLITSMTNKEIQVTSPSRLEVYDEHRAKLTITSLEDYEALVADLRRETISQGTFSLLAVGENLEVLPPGAAANLPLVFNQWLQVYCADNLD